MKTLEEAKKDYERINIRRYFLFNCESCGEDVIVDTYKDPNLISTELYEPKEIIVNQSHYDEERKTFLSKEVPIEVSSNALKDKYTYKCCNCGHIQTIEQGKMKPCNYYGKDEMFFRFSEEETKADRAFRHKHRHFDEKPHSMKEYVRYIKGDDCQFTYNITRGHIGDIIKIKCNKCGEEEDITDVTCW